MPRVKAHTLNILEKCPWHIEKKLSYIATFEDAERRMAAGQKQKRCPHCKLWIWPDQFGVDPNIKTANK